VKEPLLTERFDRALVYAVSVHRFDTRKQTAIPYVAHLLGVCSIVLEHGGSEDEAIGALLHDAAEDHGGEPRLREIAEIFGPEVERIVRDCSDALVDEGAPKGAWLPRKERYIAHLLESVRAERSSALVGAADKLYNLRSIVADTKRKDVGETVYRRFSAGKAGTLWYYRALADVFLSCEGRLREIGDEMDVLLTAIAPGEMAAALHERIERR